jgi:aminopeptidase-like protein
VLSFSDGEHDLLAIAERSGMDFNLLAGAAAALEHAGLAQTIEQDPPALKLEARA